MPDIKEKLVELYNKLEKEGLAVIAGKADMADLMIANGVTIQQWISVEERLPTEADADDVGAVLAIHKAARKKYYHWRSVADNPFDFTHWMPLPQPPKGE